MTHRPHSLVGPGQAVISLTSSRPHRGERSAGRRGSVRSSLSGWRSRPRHRAKASPRPLRSGTRRLPALHTRTSLRSPGYLSGVLCPLEPCFRATTESSIRTSSGAVAIAPSSSSTCSHSRQPVVMPADGWPGPPGDRLTRPNRGRRINEAGFPVSSDETTRPHLRPRPSPLLRLRHVSGDAPRRAGQGTISTSTRTGQ